MILNKSQQATKKYLDDFNIILDCDISKFTYKNQADSIKLICQNGHKFTSNLQTLNVYRLHENGPKPPVCTTCKSNKLIKKHEDNSNYDILDNGKIECKDCELQYDYSNLKMNCFCELKTKKKEHLFYKSLIEQFGEFKIIREYVIGRGQGHKKFDLYLTNDMYDIFIEIDDRQHFYPSSKRYVKDERFSKYILRNYMTDKKVFLIRINDDLIAEERGIDELVEVIKDRIIDGSGDERRELILVKERNEFDHIINLFEDEEIYVTNIRPGKERVRLTLI